LKVLLVGSRAGSTDEGMRKLFSRFVQEFQDEVKVLPVEPRELPRRFGEIRRFCPDVMHYMAGPSTRGLLVFLAVGALLRRASTVVSLIHPSVGQLGRFMLARAPIDLILGAPSTLSKLGVPRSRSECFSESGVDTSTFRPIPSERSRADIRRRLGLPSEGPLLLHVGHIKEGRNLDPLTKLSRGGFAVAIVGSSRTESEPHVRSELEAAGCVVTTDFQERIEEWYQAADCYVFPTVDPLNAIQLPLSILEALACGVPVASTAFGAVPDYLGSLSGVRIVNGTDVATLRTAVEDLLSAGRVSGRAVASFDWSTRADKLLGIYRSLLLLRSET